MNLGIVSIEPSALAAGIIALGIALAGFTISRQVVIEGRRIRRGIAEIKGDRWIEPDHPNPPPPPEPPPHHAHGRFTVSTDVPTPEPMADMAESQIPESPRERADENLGIGRHAADPGHDQTELLPAIEDRQERTAYLPYPRSNEQ